MSVTSGPCSAVPSCWPCCARCRPPVSRAAAVPPGRGFRPGPALTGRVSRISRVAVKSPSMMSTTSAGCRHAPPCGAPVPRLASNTWPPRGPLASIVEPRCHPDQATAARLSLIRPPPDPVAVRKLGSYRGSDHRAVAGRAGRAGQRRSGASQCPDGGIWPGGPPRNQNSNEEEAWLVISAAYVSRPWPPTASNGSSSNSRAAPCTARAPKPNCCRLIPARSGPGSSTWSPAWTSRRQPG